MKRHFGGLPRMRSNGFLPLTRALLAPSAIKRVRRAQGKALTYGLRLFRASFSMFSASQQNYKPFHPTLSYIPLHPRLMWGSLLDVVKPVGCRDLSDRVRSVGKLILEKIEVKRLLAFVSSIYYRCPRNSQYIS